MESNNNDNYVLVLEDRTEVKNEKEAGKLSVISGIDDKGGLKTTEAIAANQAAFLGVTSIVLPRLPVVRSASFSSGENL